MKKTTQQSAFDKYLEVKNEAIQDLLRERESLKQNLKDEAARVGKLLAENTKKLGALDYAVKDSGDVAAVSGKNLRLSDSEMEKSLEQILAHKPMSIPTICQHLKVARSRFEKFKKEHPNFLKQEGDFKMTVYRLNPRRTK